MKCDMIFNHPLTGSHIWEPWCECKIEKCKQIHTLGYYGCPSTSGIVLNLIFYFYFIFWQGRGGSSLKTHFLLNNFFKLNKQQIFRIPKNMKMKTKCLLSNVSDRKYLIWCIAIEWTQGVHSVWLFNGIHCFFCNCLYHYVPVLSIL